MTVLKTKAGLARMLKRVVDEWYPVAQRLTLVVDNLSTHEPSVLYEVFAPAEARLIDRLEFVYTPKHGSWLNMAEIELSVLARQCLDRRSPDMNTLRSEIVAWHIERNAPSVRVDWRSHRPVHGPNSSACTRFLSPQTQVWRNTRHLIAM